MATSSHFYYFAFGSNLCSSRIHIRNKTAQKVGIGKLSGYKLTFSGWSNFWKGCSANITPDPVSDVIGVIWIMENSDIVHLDAQEVGYHPIEVLVDSFVTGERTVCRTYVENPEKAADVGPPSLVYKKVIIAGAMENNFPEDYLNLLNAIPDNGRTDTVMAKLLDELNVDY